MKYWDSSALVCPICPNRLHREGAIDAHELGQSLERLRPFTATWTEIRPLQRVRNGALRLLRVHPMRAAEAMQLPAALSAPGEDPLTLDIVCSNVRLSQAAGREGFAVQ